MVMQAPVTENSSPMEAERKVRTERRIKTLSARV